MRESFTVAALPEQGKRAILFLSLIAVPVLLIFLGHGELTPEESEWAGSYRSIADAAKFSEPWMPQYYNSMIFGHLFGKISMIFPVSEWMFRFPVVLAAIALTAGTILLALELFDRKNAVFSGWLMLGTYGFLYWGRIGNSAMFAKYRSFTTMFLHEFRRKCRRRNLFMRFRSCSRSLATPRVRALSVH